MTRNLLVTFALTGLLSAGFLVLDETDARAQTDIVEEWVNANHLRIRINGKWEDVPLMPLAEHMCRSNNRLFKKYCGDEVLAPQDH